MNEYDDEPQEPVSDNPLRQLTDAITDPGARASIGEAVAHIDNHLQQAKIADENMQVARNFTADWDSFTGGMASWVQGDPTAMHAAMDAVPPVARGLISTIPGIAEEDLQKHHDEIVGDAQRRIAYSAIRSTAESHAGLTAEMLGDARVQGLLSEDDRHELAAYATHQADARARDAWSQDVEQRKTAFDAGEKSTLSYATSLFDGHAGTTSFPPGWHAGLLADPSVPDDMKGVLGDVYGKLRMQGDAMRSDPFALSAIVDSVAKGERQSVADILSKVTGGDLRMTDALLLSHMGQGDISDRQRQEAASLSATLKGARSYLMGRDGENGPAGAMAFRDFSRTLMDGYIKGGPGSLNPDADHYLFAGEHAAGALQRFYPTGETLLASTLKPYLVPGEQPRPLLAEIFGRAMGTIKNIPGTNIIDRGVPENGETRTGSPTNDHIDPGMVRSPRAGDPGFELNGGNTYESTDKGKTGPKMPRLSEEEA